MSLPWLKRSEPTYIDGATVVESAQDRLYEIALHEAGHAVIAYALGLTVESVTINSDPSGETLVQLPREQPSREAIMVFSGLLSEWLGSGRSWSDLVTDDESDPRTYTDFKRIERFNVDIVKCRYHALKLCQRFTPTIKTVAELLYNHAGESIDVVKYLRYVSQYDELARLRGWFLGMGNLKLRNLDRLTSSGIEDFLQLAPLRIRPAVIVA